MFPSIGILSTSIIACDIIDEGNRFLVNVNMPEVNKEDRKSVV